MNAPLPPPPQNSPKALTDEQAKLLANAVMMNQQTGIPNVGHAIADKAVGVCMPAILGYSFGVLVFVFGAGGTLFSDLPGELKRTMFGTQAAVAVGFVLGASFIDSANRYAMKD